MQGIRSHDQAFRPWPAYPKRQGTETAGEEYNFYSVPTARSWSISAIYAKSSTLNSLHMIRRILTTARQSLMFPGVPKITTLCGLEGDTLPAALAISQHRTPPLPEGTAG